MSKIIDFHAHIYPQKIVEKATESVGNFYGISMGHDGSVETLLKSGEKASVDAYVVHSVATVPHQVESINNFIAQSCTEHPGKLIGFGTLHPEMENPEMEMDRCISLGLRGIKLHPDFQKFNMDDPKMGPVYRAAAQKGLPILMHCGDYRYDYSHPRRLAAVLDNFPELTIIAAHFGGWSVFDLAVEYLLHRNCYLDTSSAIFMLGRQRTKELIQLYGADRILWGTDFPMGDHTDELEAFQSFGLSKEDAEKILYKNAEKILQISV
ncbi:MAG TPA: amidohydrolase family protein [Candidatus Gallacutalibacter pullicola]|uniref:Amidohydrolase family protein n=1 Tax=Candidatus Gallacutalibacter pullicola TaxID=2840830 RepID=A0A9D1J1A0_9FIRM|nr:amidohydrolase family protein [Candidatus Gallacutalibacter pullicola]